MSQRRAREPRGASSVGGGDKGADLKPWWEAARTGRGPNPGPRIKRVVSTPLFAPSQDPRSPAPQYNSRHQHLHRENPLTLKRHPLTCPSSGANPRITSPSLLGSVTSFMRIPFVKKLPGCAKGYSSRLAKIDHHVEKEKNSVVTDVLKVSIVPAVVGEKKISVIEN